MWFDRYKVVPEAPEHKESLQHIEGNIKQLIQSEIQTGVPHNRIVIGNFRNIASVIKTPGFQVDFRWEVR